MIESLKPFYNNLLRPAARFLTRCGLHPNIVTLAGTALYFPVAWLIAVGHWKIAVSFGVAGALFDGLDGIMARENNMKSVFGAVLDSTCDRITEILVFTGLLWYYLALPQRLLLPPLLCLVAATGSLMVSYVKARAEGAGLTCNSGILQRPERLIILGAFLMAGDSFMVWGLAIVSVAAYLTLLQRLIIIFRQ
jgi:CDP-diacylglycerol--glycerol-3-phosphate 3-phosphatidyltransferase